MRRGLAALCLSVFAACAAPRAVSPPPLGSDSLPEAAVLLRALAARRASVTSVRALARVAYDSPQGTGKAKHVIVAARPDRLRFELIAPFGPAFVLTTGQGHLSAYARSEGTFYQGAASAENLERYTNLELQIPVAVDLLLATPPMFHDADGVVSLDEGVVKLWQEAGGDIRVTWFGRDLNPIRYERRDSEGNVLLRAGFAEYVESGGASIPTRLLFELPLSQQRVEIELRDLEVNPVLADHLFALETPAGSKVVDLDQVVN
jgi:outer membrane lipoprotein-sorting protein